jgi:hypothetical protein
LGVELFTKSGRTSISLSIYADPAYDASGNPAQDSALPTPGTLLERTSLEESTIFPDSPPTQTGLVESYFLTEIGGDLADPPSVTAVN